MEKAKADKDQEKIKHNEDEENDSEGEEEDEDGDSLEGKPEDYIPLVKNARILFDQEDDAKYYSKKIIIIGHKLKDALTAGQYKKMLEFVLPARRSAKNNNDITLYASLVKRQIELVKEFYHIGDEAIEDAYGDIEKFEDSMLHWGETDAKFPKKLELFMEVEAMLYYAEKWQKEKEEYEKNTSLKESYENYDPKYIMNINKVIEMNK